MKRPIQALMLVFACQFALPSGSNAQGRPVQTLNMCEYRQPPVVVVGGVYIQQCRMPTPQESAAAIRVLQKLLKGRNLQEPYESPEQKKTIAQIQKCSNQVSETPNVWSRNKFIFECDLALKDTLAYSEKYGLERMKFPGTLLIILAYLSADPKYDEKSYSTVFAAFAAARKADILPFWESASFLKYFRTAADWETEDNLDSKLALTRMTQVAARKQGDIQTACYYANSYSSLVKSENETRTEDEMNWQKENC
jgi:hypothetical protein